MFTSGGLFFVDDSMINMLYFFLSDDALQQPLTSIFQQGDDQFKIAHVAIIWVGNSGVFAMVGQKIGHPDHFVLVCLAGSHGGNGTVILIIHHHDGFESPEI